MIRDNNESVNYFRVDIINLLPEEFWMLCNRRKKQFISFMEQF